MLDLDGLVFNISSFIAGLFLLEYGADKFIDHTAIAAKRLNVSPTLVGLLTCGAEWEEVRAIITIQSYHIQICRLSYPSRLSTKLSVRSPIIRSPARRHHRCPEPEQLVACPGQSDRLLSRQHSRVLLAGPSVHEDSHFRPKLQDLCCRPTSCHHRLRSPPLHSQRRAEMGCWGHPHDRICGLCSVSRLPHIQGNSHASRGRLGRRQR